MKKLALTLAPLAILGLAACGPTEEERVADYEENIAVTDPYSENGIWSIPEQVRPGTYRVTESTEPVTTLRWMQLCCDQYCEQPTGGGVGDMAYGHENRFITIPGDGSVRAYRNNGVKLELVEEPTGGIDCETASQAEWTEHCSGGGQ